MARRLDDGEVLVTLAEAGRRLGLANLHDYRAKYPGFPDPAPGVAGATLYLMGDVRRWYREAVPGRRHDNDTETT